MFYNYGMEFTKKDLKRIGRNISYIREGLGYRSVLDFSLALNTSGYAEDTLKKIESGNYLALKESTIRFIASLAFLTVEQVIRDDLSYIEPNSLIDFDKSLLTKPVSELDEIADIAEFYKTIFPLVSNIKFEENSNFLQAFKICNEKIYLLKADIGDIEQAIHLFALAASKDDYAICFVNILSLLGILFTVYLCGGMEKDVLESFAKKEYTDALQTSLGFHKHINFEKNKKRIEENKKMFFEAYNGKLTSWMSLVKASNEYSDYAYYYLALRYYFGMLDKTITLLSDEEMNTFGTSMLDCLDKMGNQYATKFNNLFK